MLIHDRCWQKDAMPHAHDWVVYQISWWTRCLTKAVRLEVLEVKTVEVVACYWSTALRYAAIM